MKPIQRQLRVPGQIDDLPLIARFLQDNCAEAGVDPAARFDLELAVEEACTNIIEHAYGGRGGEFEVDFQATGADVTITIRDRGKRFNPDDAADANMSLPLEQRRIGGLGLHLMHRLMDEVRFSFAPEENILVMVKHDVIPPARWADAA